MLYLKNIHINFHTVNTATVRMTFLIFYNVEISLHDIEDCRYIIKAAIFTYLYTDVKCILVTSNYQIYKCILEDGFYLIRK